MFWRLVRRNLGQGFGLLEADYDAGSGKTLIAALLMEHIIEDEIEKRFAGHPRRITFFTAEKVALVDQQHRVLSSNVRYKIGKLYRNITGMSSTKGFWDAQINAYDAIVCTPQILLDALNHGFITIQQINLLVFDVDNVKGAILRRNGLARDHLRLRHFVGGNE